MKNQPFIKTVSQKLQTARSSAALLLLPILLLLLLSASAGAQTFSYALTTQDDPTTPGEVVRFNTTVTNLTNSTQSAQLSFVVPNYTTYSYYDPGERYYFSSISLAAGATTTLSSYLTIDSESGAPPDGTIINLIVQDLDRGLSVSRSIVVQSTPSADLKLSTDSGTVAPNASFTYTLAYNNSGISTITGAKLTLPVPTGATFVSADAGGVLSSGVVQWTLGNVNVGATYQVHVTFKAPSSGVAALFLDAKFLNSANNLLAHASETKAIYATPTFSYALTTQGDPATPGEVVRFNVTVTNLTNSTQSTQLSFVVPNYTTYSYYDPGERYSFSSIDLAAGATTTLSAYLTVDSGSYAPPDGTIINLIVQDLDRGLSVSRSIVVQSTPSADLKLSTDSGTVAPNASFTYTLAYNNSGISTITGAKLTLPVPTGATFVSADAGGVLSSGVVQWTLGNVNVGATYQVHVTFKAPSSGVAALFLDAKFLNSANNLLAHASETKAIYATPTFSYALTTHSTVAVPNQPVTFDVTVRNLTNSTQTTQLSFLIPNYTTYSYYDPGERYSFSNTSIAAGATTTFTAYLTVESGSYAPSDGTLINIAVQDLARGVSLSRTVAVNRTLGPPPVPTRIISPSGNMAFGTVGIGATKTSVLTIKNTGNSTLNVSSITYPTGFSGSYAGAIPAGGTHDVTVSFKPTAIQNYSGNITVNCDKTSGTNFIPASGTGATPTRIIGLSGNLAFGSVLVGSSKTATLTIKNSGNYPLNVTSITYPFPVYTGSFSGVIPAGFSQLVTVTFKPTAAQVYNGNLTVNSDKTSGTNTLAISGTGTAAYTMPSFFSGQVALGNGVYYLAFPNGNYFGYYSYLTDPNYIYHFDLGYEYVFDAADGQGGVYLYDFASGHFFYTSPNFPFPYLYDFTLNAVLYYYPDPNNPGHYNTNGIRYFYNFNTGQIFSQ